MRFLTTVLISVAIILVPAIVLPDPGQIQVAPAATLQAAHTTTPTVTMTAKAPQAAPAVGASSVSNPDEIVCLMSAAPTRSRLGGSRECRSQRDWDRRRKESQTILSDVQLRGLQGSTSGIDGRPQGMGGH